MLTPTKHYRHENETRFHWEYWGYLKKPLSCPGTGRPSSPRSDYDFWISRWKDIDTMTGIVPSAVMDFMTNNLTATTRGKHARQFFRNRFAAMASHQKKGETELPRDRDKGCRNTEHSFVPRKRAVLRSKPTGEHVKETRDSVGVLQQPQLLVFERSQARP